MIDDSYGDLNSLEASMPQF
jgi:hypothetical protein